MRMQVGHRFWNTDGGGAGAGDTTTTTTTGTGDAQDAAFFKAEAAKAFKARDELKDKLRSLEGRTLSDEDRQLFDELRTNAQKAEEDKKRKAGEFDQWRQQIADKHQKELSDRDTKITHLSDRFKQTVISAEFGRATDYFGGETAKTILDVDLAMAALGKYVTVEDAEDAPVGYRLIVKTPRGDTILGADGNPAPFAEAIGELIKTLPNKDRILRGSGKTGSGSSGGSTDTNKAIDFGRLKSSDFNDPKVREAIKQRQAAAGGLQVGRAFDRVGK